MKRRIIHDKSEAMYYTITDLGEYFVTLEIRDVILSEFSGFSSFEWTCGEISWWFCEQHY